jgi:putative membrane protein
MRDDSRTTPRDFLAVERTFRAWIRTGLALMGLGLVPARVRIFMPEFSLNQPHLPSQAFGLSVWPWLSI